MKTRKEIVVLGAVLGQGEEINLLVNNEIKNQLPSVAEEINKKRIINKEPGIVSLIFSPTAKKQLLLKCFGAGS